jgi:hypothetical protein
MKNRIQTILIILCIIFLNTIKVTYTFKDSGNARGEMTLTVKVSPAIQALDCMVRSFLYDGPVGVPWRILNFTKSNL